MTETSEKSRELCRFSSSKGDFSITFNTTNMLKDMFLLNINNTAPISPVSLSVTDDLLV